MFDFPWSSYRWYATKNGRPGWFDPLRVLGEVGFEDTAAGRRQYAERMRHRAMDKFAEKNAIENERLRRGWCLGDASFRERMLNLLEKTGEKFSKAKEVDGAVRQSHGEDEARRLLEGAMAHFRIGPGDLVNLKRNDRRKLAIGRLIRTRTSVPNKWIADELSLGHVSGVSRYCSKSRVGTKIPRELADWVEAGSQGKELSRFTD
jgi:hypothetical protein